MATIARLGLLQGVEIRDHKLPTGGGEWTVTQPKEMPVSHVAEAVELDRAGGSPSHGLLAVMLLASVAFQRPLQLAANNLHERLSFGKLVLHVVIVMAVGLALMYMGRKLGLTMLTAGTMAALLSLVELNWSGGALSGWVMLLLVPVAVLVAVRLEKSLLLIALWAGVAAIGLTPLAQLTGAAFDRGDVHILSVDPLTGRPTGQVEDVVVVVFDEYAGLSTLRTVFDYEASDFAARLEERGMTVPPAAWSTSLSTFVSVPEMLEMAPLVPNGKTLSASDDDELYRRIGGDNRFVRAMREAGYHYTHLEGGWGGSQCGGNVDTCLKASWIDPTAWHLWKSSIVGGWLEDQFIHPFLHTALRGAETLVDSLGRYASNGRKDLVFAHILLPHGPFLLSPDCSVRSDISGDSQTLTSEERRIHYVQQVRCAESIVEDIAFASGAETGLLVVSDHGTFVGDEADRPFAEWTAEDMSHRLNVFMAYRLPDGCEGPGSSYTTVMMAAMLSCALDLGQVAVEPHATLALNRPRSERQPVVRVGEEEMEGIRRLGRISVPVNVSD